MAEACHDELTNSATQTSESIDQRLIQLAQEMSKAYTTFPLLCRRDARNGIQETAISSAFKEKPAEASSDESEKKVDKLVASIASIQVRRERRVEPKKEKVETATAMTHRHKVAINQLEQRAKAILQKAKKRKDARGKLDKAKVREVEELLDQQRRELLLSQQYEVDQRQDGACGGDFAKTSAEDGEAAVGRELTAIYSKFEPSKVSLPCKPAQENRI